MSEGRKGSRNEEGGKNGRNTGKNEKMCKLNALNVNERTWELI